MASLAVSGVGTRFRRKSGATWADLAEVNSISGPTMTRDFIDVTSLDSTGGYREFIAGFRDGGTVSLSMNFTKATYDLIYADFVSNVAVEYEIVLKDKELAAECSAFKFSGLVTELPLEIPVDDKITANVTIKVAGAVTPAIGASA